MNNIAIFASGSGTNAQNIIKYFYSSENIRVKLVLSNRKEAKVLERATQLNVKCMVFNKQDLYESNSVLNILKKEEIHWIVLAGFLWLIPENIIEEYNNHVINIHPALLPRYGGKGMYGLNVHRAVIENKDKETGISIHMVNKEYDKGKIVFQAKCPVSVNDTPEKLAQKVHELEYKHFPQVIEKVIRETKD